MERVQGSGSKNYDFNSMHERESQSKGYDFHTIKEKEVRPPPPGIYPPMGCMYPPTPGVYPQMPGMYPPAPGMYPPVQGMYPPMPGMYPGMAGMPGAPIPEPKKGKMPTVAVILGSLGILCSLLFIFNMFIMIDGRSPGTTYGPNCCLSALGLMGAAFVLSTLAIVFGSISMYSVRSRTIIKTWMAPAGLITGIVGIGLLILSIIIIFMLIFNGI
jgi:hypothetical protein